MHTTNFIVTSPNVGYYDLGAVQIHVTKRPSIMQQWFVRWCFGWKWHDKFAA